MGYIRHDAIIVTGGIDDDIKRTHARAKELGLTVSEIVDSPINGYKSFLIAPDGSKEGWTESEQGDYTRAAFIEWARVADIYVDWVAVRFGGDSESASIEDYRGNEKHEAVDTD